MTPVTNPTYMGDIRHFFTSTDITHMAGMNIDLGTYAGVRKHATNIYFHTAPPDPDMPMGAPKWSADQVHTFKNWMSNGYPLGVATLADAGAVTAAEAPARLRKDVTTLSDPELTALKTAFEGVMAREWTAPDSYCALAGFHGLPDQYCVHHEDPFNPWHRKYLGVFEDQLRTIQGCADVTLPYWDFLTPLPDVLQQPPFASYTPPPGVGLPGGTTQRNTPAEITKKMDFSHVPREVAQSLRESRWGEFNTGGYQKFSMQAHDNGHDSIGPTMADQDWASFDPVFWFFHCNIDRLWLSWQQRLGATTVQGFESTIGTSPDWLFSPFALQPWDDTYSADTIDFGVGYDKLAVVAAEPAALENMVGSLEADRTFTIRRSSPVSVRVKGIDRLSIPGTFRVVLLADGTPITQRAFFQPSTPRECATCATRPRVNLDFRLEQDEIMDRALSIEIHVPSNAAAGTSFPLSQAGNPTINVRLLLEDE